MELDKIYNMDCLEGMKMIPDGSVDAIICDLPYGTTACAWDSVIPFEPLWEQYKRIIKPKGNIVLFASGRFVFSLYNSQPDLYRYDIIWQKSRCGSPLTAPYMPLKMHEHILIFGKSASVYNPQMTTGGTPYKKDYNHAYGIKNNHKYGIKGVHTDNHGERQPISVIKYDQKWRRQDQIHPTQKPVDLLRYLVLTYSNSGGVILDSCMGSGTTAIACIKEHRHFIGFELDKTYYEKACARIDAEKQQLTLF
ncbi:MAG: site-specific DNA-methyltransferase [Bacteroidales bacterium]|nr:site-specific DNA-methyltransferase [Bacteroidales bacterium]